MHRCMKMLGDVLRTGFHVNPTYVTTNSPAPGCLAKIGDLFLETPVERADFIHLVRLSEQASAEDSQAYRRSVAIFSALGYLWVLGCFVLAVVLLLVIGSAMMQGKFKYFYVGLLLAAAGLFWSSLRSLWCRLEPPEGETLTAADAPLLFEALERIRKKIKGPPIHHVRLNSEFNASISQVPRWGLFGGAVNHLTIGLPLLLAVDRPRFLAVLAHEYGHLRGEHGQFAAWIYRTRLSWMKLSHSMRHDEGPVAAATQAFLRWYFPRFLARTFALARQDEYEADRIAGKLLGPEVTGAALTEIAIKSDWMATRFWPRHWAAAVGSAQALWPFTAMHKLLSLPPDGDFARDVLRQTLKQISDVDDTHPVLRDRLEALDVKPQACVVWCNAWMTVIMTSVWPVWVSCLSTVKPTAGGPAAWRCRRLKSGLSPAVCMTPNSSSGAHASNKPTRPKTGRCKRSLKHLFSTPSPAMTSMSLSSASFWPTWPAANRCGGPGW